jgi:hypothetical protein
MRVAASCFVDGAMLPFPVCNFHASELYVDDFLVLCNEEHTVALQRATLGHCTSGLCTDSFWKEDVLCWQFNDDYEPIFMSSETDW